MQDDLLGRHGANTANRQRFHRFFDVFVDLDVGNLFFGFKQQDFLIGQLQARLIGHHMPTTKCFVVATVAVKRHPDVDITGVNLSCCLRQRRFNCAKHHIKLHVFLTGYGFYQH